MKCFNCGKKTEMFLCNECHNVIILDKIYNEILSFKKDDENNNNKYIKEYVNSLKDGYLWDCIPKILETFKDDITEYYYCHYYKITKNSAFEELAKKYLNNHEIKEDKTQQILYDLLHFYLRNDFVKPKKYCDIILKSKADLVVELYGISADFYSMIAEYDTSQKVIKKGRKILKKDPNFIFSNIEMMEKSFNKTESLLERYKNKTPYWPTTEERRRAIAEIYDKKGISHPRLELKPIKIKEKDFKKLKEIYELPDNYVCFWCAETYNTPSIKCIYQIGALKIKDSKIIDEYQSFIKPWDGLIAKKRAAKEAKVDLDEIESARDVDFVMKEFLNFIEDYSLVSTDALGNQAKLLIRALRYSGIDEIKNGFFDILDYATDIDGKFDLENNNRDYLLKYFGLKEGKDSLKKAKTNYELVNKLRELEN